MPRGREGKRGGRGEKAVGNGQCEGRRRRATLSRMRNNANLNGSHDGHPLYERKNKTGRGGWFLSMPIEIGENISVLQRNYPGY